MRAVAAYDLSGDNTYYHILSSPLRSLSLSCSDLSGTIAPYLLVSLFPCFLVFYRHVFSQSSFVFMYPFLVHS